MIVVERCQAKRVVFSHILFVPNTHKGRIQQTYNGCEHFFTRESREREVMGNSFTNLRKCPGEGDDLIVLCLVAYLAPLRMIAILLASLCIAPGCLDVASRIRADPDISPGRWN